MYHNVPKELTSYNAWIVWRLEWKQDDLEHKEKPTKIPYQVNGYQASIINPSHWTTFQEVAKVKFAANKQQVFKNSDSVLETGYSGIGFCLSKFDPFSGIDLDYTDNQEEFATQLKIYNNFNSYSEISPSGKGLRIFCYGSLLKGRRRSNVEIYSDGRFLSVTGNVYNPAPIAHRQELLDILWAEMGPPNPVSNTVTNQPQREDDTTILKWGCNASNGEKFTNLFQGNWNGYYPSQSEADFALIDMLAFYTQNVEQIIRLFHMSQLGKRDKAKRQDYLMYMINKSFDRQLPFVDLNNITINGKTLAEGAATGKIATPSYGTGEQAQARPGSGANSQEASTNSSAAEANLIAHRINVKLEGRVEPNWPPGLLGEIAYNIYQMAPRPCYEIALGGAISLMAGICGRCYNVSGTGLNVYTLVLAMTGGNKEAAASGVSKIMTKLKESIPSVMTFIGPGDIKSDAGLIKWVAKNKSFVSIVGEFGLRFQQMSSRYNNPHETGIKRVMLDLYNKSGKGSALNPLAYSDKDKNTDFITSPAFSMFGEAVPETFYSSIDENIILDGLLPRFLIIEYKGQRPALSKTHQTFRMSEQFMERLRGLTSHSLSQNQSDLVTDVEILPDAEEILNDLELKTTEIINTSKEIKRQLWNRAHIKVLKIASLLAIGINSWKPQVDKNCVNWAMKLVIEDIENISSKFNLGQVGEESKPTFASDDNQLGELIKIIGRIARKETVPKYGLTDEMLAKGVYTFSSLQQLVSQVACYRKDKNGSTFAFKRAIQILIDSGDIKELNSLQVEKEFGKKAKCFVVTDYQRFMN